MIRNEHELAEALADGLDLDIVAHYLGSKWKTRLLHPDIMIYGSSDHPYLYRWWLYDHKSPFPNSYFHVQVQDDPDRPLHDHPWDNVSLILAGGYEEWLDNRPMSEQPQKYKRAPGDMIPRRAEQAHRLLLPDNVPYSMSLFHTAAKRRSWGFWALLSTGPKWFPSSELIEDLKDGRSMFHMPKDPNR